LEYGGWLRNMYIITASGWIQTDYNKKNTWGFAVSSVKVISSGSTWTAALLCEDQCRLLQCQRKNSRRRVGLGAGAPTLPLPQTPYSSGVSLLLRSPELATSRGDYVNFLSHDRCHAIRLITLYVRKITIKITITWFPSYESERAKNHCTSLAASMYCWLSTITIVGHSLKQA
jgi:hypothetical protein